MLLDQEKLAQYFNVKIDESVSGAFNVSLAHLSSHGYDEWMMTIESEKEINNFFKDAQLPLSAKAYRYSQINNLSKFIHDQLIRNNDLRVEYKLHNIFDSRSIHDWLIETVSAPAPTSIKDAVVVMLNPTPSRAPRFVLGVEKLMDALSDKFARETGIVVVSGDFLNG